MAFSQTGAVVPIVGAGYLLGGVKNGKWVSYEQTVPLLKQTDNYILVGLRDENRPGKAVSGTKSGEGDACPEVQTVNFEPEFAGFGIGEKAVWKPLPRVPQEISTANKTYGKAAADFLKSKGIVTKQARLTQIFRADLDGDGQDEIVMTGIYYKRGIGAPQSAGDYSFVMVRRIVGGAPRNILLEGDFATRRRSDVSEPPYQREVTAIADLNGDGKMEILVYWHFFEGEAATVYELRGSKFRKVFERGCGA